MRKQIINLATIKCHVAGFALDRRKVSSIKHVLPASLATTLCSICYRNHWSSSVWKGTAQKFKARVPIAEFPLEIVKAMEVSRDETHQCDHSHYLKGCQGGLVNELMKTIWSHHKHSWEDGTCERNHDTKGTILHDGGKWQQP